MKKLLVITTFFVIIGCNTEPSDERKELTSKEYFQELENLNDSLINLKPIHFNLQKELGINVKNKAISLYNNNESDFNNKEVEFLLSCAAKSSEILKQYEDAQNYFLKLQKKFPNGKNAPVYLHNRARILDDLLNDKNNARLAYEDLISLYPEHPLSKNAVIYLENVFGKSNEELLELIKSN